MQLDEMIAWSGSGATLSMFVVVIAETDPELRMAVAGSVPTEIRKYQMEPSDGYGRYRIIEYDALFPSVPAELSAFLAGCLAEAQNAGALVAWFAFEGSFHFDHLLTPDVASQIYALVDSSGMAIASHASQVLGADWADRIAAAKSQLP